MARSRSRGAGGATALGSVLRGLGTLRVPQGVEASPVALRDWEAAVGSRIAQRARPLKLERGVLYVRAATSTWAQELSMLADAIIAQLAGRGVVVRQLRFSVGAIEAETRIATRTEVKRGPVDAPLPPELAADLAAVNDLDLRAAIARAASKNLGWQVAVADSARRTARANKGAVSRSALQDAGEKRPAGGRRDKP